MHVFPNVVYHYLSFVNIFAIISEKNIIKNWFVIIGSPFAVAVLRDLQQNRRPSILPARLRDVYNQVSFGAEGDRIADPADRSRRAFGVKFEFWTLNLLGCSPAPVR